MKTKDDQEHRIADIGVEGEDKGAGHMDSCSVGKGQSWNCNVKGHHFGNGARNVCSKSAEARKKGKVTRIEGIVTESCVIIVA